MAYEPINRRQVIEALREFGPMTRYDLAEHLGWTPGKVGTTISSTRWLLPGQVFRIVRYRDRIYQGRLQQVAVFAAEAGTDAVRPAMDADSRRLLINARYREKNRASINAKDRARRARAQGADVVVNPWLQLAPPNMRAAMSQRPPAPPST